MKILLRLLSYVHVYTPHMVAGLFFSFIMAICTVYPAWIMKSVVNDVLVNRDLRMLHVIAISLVVVLGIKGIFNFLQSYIMNWIAQSILMKIRSESFDQLLQLTMSYYEKQRTGQIMSRITSDVLVLQNMLGTLTGIMGDVIAFFSFCVYIFFLHWKLALISVVIIPFIGALISKFSRKMKKVGLKMQTRIGDLATVLQEFITGVKVVKSFTLEPFMKERFEKANMENFKETMRGNRINSATSPIIEFINTIGLSIIFWYGGYEVIHGRLDAGQLISFLTALVGLFTPIKNISKFSNIVSQSIGAGERVYEIIDAPVEIKERPDPVELNECQGHVTFENVSFSYKEGEPVLNNISLSVQPGEVVALVGPSGSGKTTIVNLIARFYDVQSGVIKVDGCDIRDFSLASLRRNIGLVPQETLLFSGSVAENLRLGRLDASDEEVVEAARLANAATFIQAMPDGFDSHIGERGVNLSGGQGQRIALARAFLKDPPILILDEATSALDSETENLVKEALNCLMKDRTTFIIAHRLSTIMNANKIVVLQKGNIVELGTHAQLLEQKGLYFNLYHAQFQNQSNGTPEVAHAHAV
jgi:subfamily B ATP-binding cassette protein MsbA